MNWRGLFGVFLTVCTALALAGCLSETPKHLKPLSEETKALLAEKGLKEGAAMFVRIFKQDAELEVWLAADDGRYHHFKTYDICYWSGDIGPKEREGDKQAPEGFYVVTPGQMNPWSKYHLAFNIGYPNAYDRSFGRTGQHLMVHGGCRSAGCYAVTDENVQEIFSLARDAFLAGQREFHVHAFPFRMTEANLAIYRNHRWYDFWKNLKEGYDLFERNRRPPIVGAKDGRYVFFDRSDDVPREFTKVSSAGDPKRPRLITGWSAASPAPVAAATFSE